MSRLLGVLAVATLLLAVAGSARAWTPIASPVGETVVGLRTHTGAELLVWTARGGIVVSRSGGIPVVAVPDDGSFATPELAIELPSRTVILYYVTTRGRYRVSSEDDGRTWRAPVLTAFPLGSTISAAVVRRDGTPLFAGTMADASTANELWDFAVFRGVDGESMWLGPLGDFGTVGLGSGNRVYVVYWSDESMIVNGRATGTFWRALGPDGAPSSRVHRLAAHDVGAFLLRGRAGRAVAAVPHELSLRLVNLETRSASTRALPSYTGGGVSAPVQGLRGRVWVVWEDRGRVYSARADRLGGRFRRGEAADYPGQTTAFTSATALVPFARADGTVDVVADVDGTLLRRRFRVR